MLYPLKETKNSCKQLLNLVLEKKIWGTNTPHNTQSYYTLMQIKTSFVVLTDLK